MLIIDSKKIQSIDRRRNILIAENQDAAIRVATEHWIHIANTSINARSRFAVALSGGSTPNGIYQLLAKKPYSTQVDWSKVYLFWSDERAVLPNQAESNYHSAMTHGLSHLPILPSHIFRMQAEKDLVQSAIDYESLIKKTLGLDLFDLVMLGVGEDGHTASLFPNTLALQSTDRLVMPNYVEEKKSWRMTLTISCINQSRQSVFYAWGPAKQIIVNNVLRAPANSPWPASQIGSPAHKALWIIDASAAELLLRE